MRFIEAVFSNCEALAAIAVGGLLAATAYGFSRQRMAGWLRVILLILLALHLIVFLEATLSYVAYPYEGKSVVEGAIVYNGEQYLHGIQPYRNPEAVPLTTQVYPPVYEMVLAGIFSFVGVSLSAARAFSLICALATAFVCGLAAFRMTGKRFPALLAGGFLVTFYGVTGHWMEQARNDSLTMFLITLGFYLSARRALAGKFPVAGIVCFFLAIFTKQVAIFAPVVIILFLWPRSRKAAVAWAGGTAVVALAAFLAMQVWSHGWFAFWIFQVPMGAGIEWSQLRHAGVFLANTWLFLWGSVFLLSRERADGSSDEPRFWGWGFLLALALCLVQSVKWGATLNAFLPVVPFMAILSAVAFSRIWERSAPEGWARPALLAAAIMQSAIISYPPILPSAADFRAQRRISEWVLAAPGEAFVDVFSSQVYLNGKRYYGDAVTMGDLQRAGVWHGSEIIEMAQRGDFSLMILRPKVEPEELALAVKAKYKQVEHINMPGALTAAPYMNVYVPESAPWRPAESN